MTSGGRGDCTHDRRRHALFLLGTFASPAADDYGARPAAGQPALRRFAHRHQISPLRTPEAATAAIKIVVQNGGQRACPAELRFTLSSVRRAAPEFCAPGRAWRLAVGRDPGGGPGWRGCLLRTRSRYSPAGR
jgi:hypothetical protein